MYLVSSNSSNSTKSEEACCMGFSLKMTMPILIVGGMNFPVAFASAFLNSTVLWAIYKVKKSKLRAKYFIQNLCLSHIILPCVIVLQPQLLSGAFGPFRRDHLFCIEGVFFFVLSLLYLVQPSCVIVLTADRVFAVSKPLMYNTVGYSKPVLCALVAFPGLTASFISFGIFLFVKNSGELLVVEFPPICNYFHLAFAMMEHVGVVDIFLLTSYTVVFFFTLTVLIIMKIQQRTMTSLSSSSSARTYNTSLVITYLLINVTSIVLYIPAPIYTRIVGSVFVVDTPQTNTIIEVGLLILYQCNSFLDPLILLRRVPSIKSNWSQIWRKQPVSVPGKMNTREVKPTNTGEKPIQ